MNSILSRRSLLAGAAVLAGGLATAACTQTQISNFEAQWATVAGTIQQAVAKVSAYIPTIESIASTAASLFGPQYAALVQIGSVAFNQIVTALTNIVANLAPPAASRLAARLSVSSPVAPVAIGVTSKGVQVVGWRA